MVGLPRIELGTSSLSGMRSNRLSYSPGKSQRLSAAEHVHATADASIVSVRNAAAVVDHSLADDRTGCIVRDYWNFGLGTTNDEAAHR
jgi:hypothetical protein